MDDINLKKHEEYKTYTNCMAGYDSEKKSVTITSTLGAALLENYNFKERFLPTIPALRINS